MRCVVEVLISHTLACRSSFHVHWASQLPSGPQVGLHDLRHVVDVRPVYHRLEERIKAHVLLCWLALLLIRVAENETATTWHQLKKAFRPLMAGYHASPHGPIIQSNPLTADQKRHLKALKIDAPARYLHIPTPPATPQA